MNNLSWLLYWADALPSVAMWLCIVAFFGLLISLFFALLGFTGFFGDEAKGVEYAEEIAPRFRKMVILVPIFFLLWGLTFLVPDKQTFYLIAASEMGEEVVKTPEFDKIRKIVGNYLDEQLSDGETGQPDNSSS